MPKINQISKEQFEVNKELKAMYGSYENYMAAQMKQLKLESIHTFAKNQPAYMTTPAENFFNMRMEAYDKHLAQSEKLIANYKLLEAQYEALLKQQNSINSSLMSKYQVSSQKDLITTMNDNNSLYDQSVYNKTSNSVNEAYSKFIAALQTANYQTHRIV